MKHSIQVLFVALLAFTACNKPAAHHDHNDPAMDDNDPNEALYNEVNEYHDRVMKNMEDMYNLQGRLKEKIANATSMADEKKQEIQGIIAELDSADRSMRSWMHGWMDAPTDSVDKEKTREFFESEMEQIKKVEEQMNEAIDHAKAEVDKK